MNRLKTSYDRISAAVFRGKHLGILLASFVVLMGLSSAWAIVQPIGTVPDEPAHIIKAVGVAHGQPYGVPFTDSTGRIQGTFEIPVKYASAPWQLGCNAFQPSTNVSVCTLSEFDNPSELAQGVSAAAFYNPVYYAMVGWPSLLTDGISGMYGMRLASAFLCSLFLALSVWILSFLRRPAVPMVALMGAVTPALLFYAGGVNPQAAEVAVLSTFTAALFVSLQLRVRAGAFWALAAVMVVSGALAAQMRNLSWVWLGVIVIVALIAYGWRQFLALLRKPAMIAAVVVVLLAVAANLAIVYAFNTLNGGAPLAGAGHTFADGFITMVYRAPEFFASMVSALGWNDYTDHWSLYIVVSLSVILVALALMSSRNRKMKVAVLASLASLWLFPALIQGYFVTSGGYIWQGRYSLPLYFLVIITAAFVVADEVPSWTRRTSVRVASSAIVALALAQWTAFSTTVFRQYLGIGSRPTQLFFPSDPSIAQAPVFGNLGWIVIVLVVSLAWGAVLALFVRQTGTVADLTENASGRGSDGAVPHRA